MAEDLPDPAGGGTEPEKRGGNSRAVDRWRIQEGVNVA